MAQKRIEIRARYWITPEALYLFLPDGTAVDFQSEDGKRVVLRIPPEEDIPDSLPRGSMICEVYASTSVSTNRKRLLDQLVVGRMPDGSGPVKDALFPKEELERYRDTLDDAGNLRKGVLPALEHLPNTLRDLVDEKSRLLYDIAEYTLRALRWRAGATGGPEVLMMNKYFEWSEDGLTWHPIWSGNTISMSVSVRSPIREEYREFVQPRMGNVNAEPLWHELYREAEVLCEQSPRSALLTLVSAAEVAVKQCIAACVPAAATIVEDTDSPDIVSLIEEHASALQTTSSAHDLQIMPPPSAILEELRAAVSARNDVAHQGKAAPDPRSLKKKFNAVRDLLWLLDSCTGQPWALRFVSPATRQLLTRVSNA